MKPSNLETGLVPETGETKTSPELVQQPESTEERLKAVEQRMDQIQESLSVMAENSSQTEQQLQAVRHTLEVPTPEEPPHSVVAAEDSMKKASGELENLKAEKARLAPAEANTPNVDAPEAAAKKPLEVGDEIVHDGLFYKVMDIRANTPEDIQKQWEADKTRRDVEFSDVAKTLSFSKGPSLFETRQKFDEDKRTQLEQQMSKHTIKAMLNGSDGQYIELDEDSVNRVESPEQRDKIVEMQKDQSKAEDRAASFAGFGAEKKIVDIVAGHPGRF